MKKSLISLGIAVFLAGCSKQQPLIPVEPQFVPTNTPPVVAETAKEPAPTAALPTTTFAVHQPATTTLATTTTYRSDPPATSRSKNIAVPFTSQAPYEVWDALHEEACEEASMIMAAAYFAGEELGKHPAEQKILSLVKWEADHGYQIDLTAEEVASVLQDHFNLTAVVTTDVTVDRIKTELTSGNLIIVPAAGRQLGNPYFTAPGPIYHMLVIRGYDDTHFITNDPGTKRGEEYRYTYQRLLNAVHNWSHERAAGGMTDEEMDLGERVMVVVSN